MTVTLKTPQDIAKMRIAGKLAADVLEMIAEHVKPGVTTDQLNQICHDYIVNEQKAIPAPLNYKGYPKSICTSINHVVCHGIPNDKPLKDGDTLNIDVTVIKDGYHGDTSRMFHVGNVPVWAERLSGGAGYHLHLQAPTQPLHGSTEQRAGMHTTFGVMQAEKRVPCCAMRSRWGVCTLRPSKP